ncbi:hypothetical protein M569_02824, partial [Genlisea aurea]
DLGKERRRSMATVDLIRCCLDSIRQISENIDDAIVYLDAGSTESFQLIEAFPLFLELGARAVCSLESISALDKVVGWSSNPDHVVKIAVITSSLLSDAHRYILRCLSKLQSVKHCAIYTSISEVAHSAYPDSPLGPDAFHEYATLLKQDYEELVKRKELDHSAFSHADVGKDGITLPEDEGWSHLTSFDDAIAAYDDDSVIRQEEDTTELGVGVVRSELVVSVHHFPLIVCPLSPRVFALPSEGCIAEASLSTESGNSISSALPPLSTGKLTDTDDAIPGASLTAHFLYHLALKMDLKLEIFSMGDLSKNVGKLLMDMSSIYDVGRRKRSAGLLLIDRTLDLLTPCYHGDSLLDRMLSTLPRGQHKATVSQTTDSEGKLEGGVAKVRHLPLTVQIPLESFILQDDSKSYIKLLESLESFVHGWNSIESDSQNSEPVKFRKQPNDESFSCFHELHGTFVSTHNFRGAPYLEAIVERRTKDSVMLIKKWLQESLRQEKVSVDVKVRPGFPSKSELHSLVKLLAKRQSSLVKYKGIIQLAAATVCALDELNSTKWDAFSSAEKILHVNAADASQSLAAQISDLINKTALGALQLQNKNQSGKSRGVFTLEDALLLTIVGYILAGENFPTSGSGGPFSWQEEQFMKEAIMDAVLENPAVSKLKFLHGISEKLECKLGKSISDEKKDSSDPSNFNDDQWGDFDDDKDASKDHDAFGGMQLKLELRDRVDNLFKFFHKLSAMKRNAALREGGPLPFEGRRSENLHSSKGLLYRLLESVLEKHDIPGLEYHSSTVGRLFKSGFGRFGLGQAKPSLADQSVILIFVIGGINGVEVREVQEAVAASSRPDVEVILGGTTFLTPNDMRELLLGDYSYI